MQPVGKSGIIQKALRHKLGRIRDRVLAGIRLEILERRQLLTGPPGVGKSNSPPGWRLFVLADHPMAVEKKEWHQRPGTSRSSAIAASRLLQTHARLQATSPSGSWTRLKASGGRPQRPADLPRRSVTTSCSSAPPTSRSNNCLNNCNPFRSGRSTPSLMTSHRGPAHAQYELPHAVALDIARRVSSNVRCRGRCHQSHRRPRRPSRMEGNHFQDEPFALIPETSLDGDRTSPTTARTKPATVPKQESRQLSL